MAEPQRQGEDTDILVWVAVIFVAIVGVGFLADAALGIANGNNHESIAYTYL